jgi:hypothetical protein
VSGKKRTDSDEKRISYMTHTATQENNNKIKVIHERSKLVYKQTRILLPPFLFY